MASGPLLLCILDGWGHNPRSYGNAIKAARTPVFDSLVERYPMTYLRCQGEAVGLREGLMGNSEVGHENLGAGRIVLQEILFIDRAIDDGSFFDKDAFVNVVKQVKANDSVLHLSGLTSDGGVHSAEKHYFALVDLAKQAGLRRDQVMFHVITDGRDTDPHSGIEYVRALQKHLDEVGVGRIATIVGRYYAMDRDMRWPRTQLAYDAMVHGENKQKDGDLAPILFETASDPLKAIEARYDTGKSSDTDEFLTPILLTDEHGDPLPRIGNGDGLIFFNFRGDRPRQILHALADDTFDGFDRCGKVNAALASMTQYSNELAVPYSFKRERPVNIVGEVIADAGLKQLRCAETEKYPHVTFFFNNQRYDAYPAEQRLMVKSPPVATYDLQPEMSAYRLAGGVIDEAANHDVIVLNFANPDMVGHTGVFEAAIQACEAVDQCLGLVLARVRELGGRALVTADHGNAEEMINYELVRDENGNIDYSLRIPHTTHTPMNLTPCVLVDDDRLDAKMVPAGEGKLGDVGPTMLKLLGLKQPEAMTGVSLF